MFKKTLIAAAVVATTATFGAFASTVAVTGETVGVEYAVGINTVTANDVTITTGRGYAAGDIITLTATGASLVTMTGTTAYAPTITNTGTGKVEFLDYSGSQIRLLVSTPVASGDVVTVSGIKLNVGSASNKGTVKFSAAGRVSTVDGPINVDTSTAVTYITYADELATSIKDKFSAVVDVNANRQAFDQTVDKSADSTSADTLVLTNTVATVGSGRGVTTNGATYTVYGNFSFLDKDGNGKLGDAGDGSVASSAGTTTYAADFSWAKVTSTSALTSGTVGITVNAPTGVTIPDQAFMAQADVSYANPADVTKNLSANTLAKGAAGSWTLNGSKSHVPFLPFSSAYSQSVTISNTSAQSGGVDLVIYTGSGTVSVSGIATAKGNGVTDISAAVRAAVAANGLSGNLAFDVVVNAPSANITTTAVYYAKADGDRLRTK